MACSIARYWRSTSSSKAITSSASSGSFSRSALIEPRSGAKDELALLEQGRLESVELLLKRHAHDSNLTESAGHVVLCSLVGGLREDLLRLVELDEDARPFALPARRSMLKKAVMSATRAACCMLCVTITIV